jgi:ubiquinone/menaquinone biosynthesis C-methylase UbiE
MSNTQDLVKTTQDYYDSPDADNFYFHIWGGEDIHVGMYTEPGDSILDASARTVREMAERLTLDASTKVLDIGAGYGGAARYLAKTYGCEVVCFNLSETENQRNREKNEAQGLADKVSVVGGNFEALPFEGESFDVVWCEDAILHSGEKAKVFEEVVRVLRPGGEFIFTDPMQSDDCDPSVLTPILQRIHLKEMGSVAKYKQFAQKLGLEPVQLDEMPEQLVNHYSSVLRMLEKNEAQLAQVCSDSYLANMKKGLRHWIDGGQAGHLNWGILHFRLR